MAADADSEAHWHGVNTSTNWRMNGRGEMACSRASHSLVAIKIWRKGTGTWSGLRDARNDSSAESGTRVKVRSGGHEEEFGARKVGF